MNAANVIGMVAIRHDRKRVQPDDFPNPLTRETIDKNVNCQRMGNVAFVDGHGEYVSRIYAHEQTHWDPKF
jgi:prepilin-type processing-associated H-X9-DG protein